VPRRDLDSIEAGEAEQAGGARDHPDQEVDHLDLRARHVDPGSPGALGVRADQVEVLAVGMPSSRDTREAAGGSACGAVGAIAAQIDELRAVGVDHVILRSSTTATW